MIAALGLIFNDNLVVVDPATYNAARLWKLYGTLAAKGDSTHERPHRLARLEPFNASNCETVTKEMLEAVAASLPPTRPAPAPRAGAALDVAAWLAAHGLAVDRESAWNDGHRYVLETCPLNPEHSRSAYVVQFGNGAIAAGCQHKSCAALDWKTLRAMYESERAIESPKYSDDWLALAVVERHGQNLRYCGDESYVWAGTKWEPGHAVELVRGVCREVANAMPPGTKEHPANRKRLVSGRTISAVERLCRSDEQLQASPDLWDADPFLLNTPAGTVDLCTGVLREHRRQDFITKMTAVTPSSSSECPLWLKFLDRVTGADLELQSFLQRLNGYALTGSTREHMFAFLYGGGANGKTSYLSASSGAMGSYAVTAPASTFTASAQEQHPTDVARLHGARLVTTSEIELGKRWATAKIKSLTGADTVAARFMHGDFSSFGRSSNCSSRPTTNLRFDQLMNPSCVVWFWFPSWSQFPQPSVILIFPTS